MSMSSGRKATMLRAIDRLLLSQQQGSHHASHRYLPEPVRSHNSCGQLASSRRTSSGSRPRQRRANPPMHVARALLRGP